MTNYELMFIIDPTLEDEKKEATVETVKVSSKLTVQLEK